MYKHTHTLVLTTATICILAGIAFAGHIPVPASEPAPMGTVGVQQVNFPGVAR